LLTYGLNAAALSTYHDYLAPDKLSENWACWAITGLAYGLAAFPLVWTGFHLGFILIRAAALAVLICLWSEWISRDWLEEGGRGFLYIATLPLLTIL